jgi:polyadenylate-binding protein
MAEKAIKNLNGKEISGKKIEVTLLIPSKNKSSIYAKNFPRDFKEDDLKKFFSKFGEITSVSISKDQNGYSKGFGFINFVNFQDASSAIKKTNEEQFTFPSCLPLYVSFPIKKEEREYLFNKNVNPNRYPKLFARKIDINLTV